MDSMTTIRNFFNYPDTYYNCSGKSVEEWMETGEKWPKLGKLFVMLGVVYLLLYIPTIYAILKLRLTKNPCYQIMLCIIFADMTNLVANSLFCGFLMSMGAVFCMNPVFMYIEGVFNQCSWMFASPLYVILAFNRFIVITGWVKVTHYVTRIPIYFWLILASAWSFYTGVIHKPLIYNSKSFLAFYIPFIEDQQIELPKYENRMHGVNNVLFSILITFFYLMISIMIMFGRHEKLSSKEKNALVQAAFLTCPAIIGCFLYLYIQFSNKSTVGWAILGQFLWQTITGLGAIIYLTLNQSVRDFYFHRSAVYHDGSRHFDISKTSGERERNETGNS